MTRPNGIIFVVGAAMMAAHLPAVASTPQSHAAADNDKTAKEMISEDAQAWAQSILKSCQQQQQQQQQSSSSSSISVKDCVHQQLSHAIAATRDDISYFRQVRTRQGSQWEDYACEDFALETSPALEERVWVDPATASSSEAPNNNKPVRVLHDYSSSQIHVLEDFISPEECDAILQESEDYLHRAKVHDGKGGDHFSDHRKAWQAGIEVDWDYELDDDTAYYSAEEMIDHYIAKVSRRVYEYTNHVLPGLDISPPGQENLMSIQYFGNPSANTTEPPDRYAPHCDGECNGRPHKRGTRMATMVMYCEVPTKGGHTNFRHAGVHIQPKVGSALFFSYMDPITGIHDHGFTSHSGCPVYEGSKKIVTQWVRLGVDEENPHYSFNTLGVQVDRDDEDYDDEEEEYGEEDEDHDDEGKEFATKTHRRGLQRIRHHIGRGLQNLRKLSFRGGTKRVNHKE